MEESILKIVKDKDDWKYTIEIKENAKGEAQVSVKVRSDSSVKDAGNEAFAEYTRIKKELAK